ncbi:MAG TPA: hypothetical protein VGG73_14860 [Vicinamibacterales bacterium]|jgi:hypothetical protein
MPVPPPLVPDVMRELLRLAQGEPEFQDILDLATAKQLAARAIFVAMGGDALIKGVLPR